MELRIKDLVYEIKNAKVYFRFVDGELVIAPDLETDYVEFKGEKPLIRLYFNDGFKTGVKTCNDLIGKKFVWEDTNNAEGEPAGYLYVFEHENVAKGELEILEASDSKLRIHWTGLANIFWDEEYSDNVPFDTTFEADIKQ